VAEQQTQKTAITAEDWSRGAQDAPVTLLEYGDFECPFCGAAYPLLQRLLADFPDTLRLVYRHFPITTVHPHAKMAAQAAEAAGAQHKFWEMHDQLFEHQHHLEPAELRNYAAAIGLDLQRFDDDMAAHKYAPPVREDFQCGVRDGANGTPTLFLNGVRYDGPPTYESLALAVGDARKTNTKPAIRSDARFHAET
jgi:protein-disulfide isomerase